MTSNEIYFDADDIFSKVYDILGKNGVKETLVDAAFTAGPSLGGIIIDFARKFVAKEISEEEFVKKIQEQLKVDDSASQNIIKSLKQEIIPLAKSVDNSDARKKEINNIPGVPVKNKTIPINAKNVSKGKPDNYREPIN